MNRSWEGRGFRIELDRRPCLMGIINVTPDSFSDGGTYPTAEAAAIRALVMVAEGADIVDVGGESTRPGAVEVDARTEMDRVIPVIEAIRSQSPIPISVDTRKAVVAQAALEAGANVINDVSGFNADPEMAGVAARSGAGLVLMHMRGTPATMQGDTDYADLMGEIREGLAHAVESALQAGVSSSSIVVDPGIGFGKTAEQNVEILRRLGDLRDLGYPIMVGVSRKSFLGRMTGAGPSDRGPETVTAVLCAHVRGASIHRVHDVLGARKALRVRAVLTGEETFDS